MGWDTHRNRGRQELGFLWHGGPRCSEGHSTRICLILEFDHQLIWCLPIRDLWIYESPVKSKYNH